MATSFEELRKGMSEKRQKANKSAADRQAHLDWLVERLHRDVEAIMQALYETREHKCHLDPQVAFLIGSLWAMGGLRLGGRLGEAEQPERPSSDSQPAGE